MENQKLSSRSPEQTLRIVYQDRAAITLQGYFEVKRDGDWLEVTKKVIIEDEDMFMFINAAQFGFYKPESYSLREAEVA